MKKLRGFRNTFYVDIGDVRCTHSRGSEILVIRNRPLNDDLNSIIIHVDELRELLPVLQRFVETGTIEEKPK